MKLKNLFNIITLGTALTITAVGCKKNPGYLTKLPNGQTKPPTGDGTFPGGQPVNPGTPIQTETPSNPTPVGGGPLGPGHEGWAPDTEALKAQTVYFEYDKSSIKSSEQPKLDQVADYLKSHPEAAVRVEGNCDERGTEEYNRSLGERRALAAREYLVRLGVDANRIDTISYGKDRPLSPEHNETGFSKNRRDDFVVLTAPK